MNNNKGFSLIEIVIFGFIAITLLTLFIGLAVNSKEFARTLGCVNNMKNIAQALENFQADNRTTPVSLEELYPLYIENRNTFKCPADRTTDINSYEQFYIGRFIGSAKTNKVFLACPRHHRRTKTVAAYLSYAVDIGENKKVQWSGTPAEYGQLYTGGEMTFADGTTVSINSGTLCLVSSFVDNQEKMYSIIHTPEESATNLTVNHTGDSTFEVITPAVIAGVEGTKFTVKNLIDAAKHLTDITVLEGIVYVEDRQRDATEITVKPGDGTFDVTVNLPEEEEHDKDTTPRKRNWVPRKPRKRK